MELMLALTLIAIAALTLVALSFTAISSRQKAENITDATLIAQEQLAVAVHRIETLPFADHATFWDAAPTGPISQGSVDIGETKYDFKIEAADVNTGTVPPNRMRKLDITVWWWGGEQQGGRAGQGQLQYNASRLVREVVNDAP